MNMPLLLYPYTLLTEAFYLMVPKLMIRCSRPVKYAYNHLVSYFIYELVQPVFFSALPIYYEWFCFLW